MERLLEDTLLEVAMSELQAHEYVQILEEDCPSYLSDDLYVSVFVPSCFRVDHTLGGGRLAKQKLATACCFEWREKRLTFAGRDHNLIISSAEYLEQMKFCRMLLGQIAR